MLLVLWREDSCRGGERRREEQHLALVLELIWLTCPSSSFISFTLLQVPLFFYLSRIPMATQKYPLRAQTLLGGTPGGSGWRCAALCWHGQLQHSGPYPVHLPVQWHLCSCKRTCLASSYSKIWSILVEVIARKKPVK